MLQTLYYEMQLTFAQQTNRFIYTIRKIKPIRNQISEEWYANADLKKTLGILAMIWAFFVDVFKKVCYFTLAIAGPNIIINEAFMETSQKTLGRMILWTFFFMNCMLGSFVNSHITNVGSVEEKDYLILNLMRFNPKKHYLAKLLWDSGRQLLYYGIIIWIVIGGILHVKGLPVVWLLGVYICFRFIGEAVRLKLHDRFGIPFQEKNKAVGGFYSIYNFFMFLLAYVTYPLLYCLSGMPPEIAIPFLETGWVLVLLLAMGVAAMVFSIRYLLGYGDYVLVARRLCNLQRMQAVQDNIAAASKSSYELRDKEINEEELRSHMYQNKSGYDYLNAIFFQRHKRLVRNTVRIKMFIVVSVLGIAAVGLLIAQLFLPAEEFGSLSNSIWKTVGDFMPILVFIMYFGSSGQNLTKAMFFNCDISLLKYGYYRTPEAVLQGFRIRLKYMVQAELPTVGAFTVGIVVNTLLLHQQRHWLQMLSIIICVGILTVFYSVVFLCMYYIFQPFTEGGEETGMGYKLCSIAIYWLAYMCLQIHTVPSYFTVLALGVTVVALAAGSAIAWRVAPKTFRLK